MVRKRILDPHKINSGSECTTGKWYTWLQERGWEVSEEREPMGGPPISLRYNSQGQAGSCPDADISAVKFTFCVPKLGGWYDYLHSHWSLLLWAMAGFLEPGPKAVTGGRT